VQQLTSIASWRSFANEQRAQGRTIGLVPTMGALHEGHASLFREAKARGDLVIATIFVNPRQFNNVTDLGHYPRTPERDVEIARENGVDCLVEPSLDEMWPDYPHATATTVSVRGISDRLEGASRPGHFDGVASVVAKLFNITGASRAYFGEKDFQQIAVVRQMVRDLGFDVDVVSCPIIRDDDGLALSSRNVLLDDDGRLRARALSRALQGVEGEKMSASAMRRAMRDVLEDAGIDVAYADVVDPFTFQSSGDDEEGERRAMVAGVVSGVRLIDNASVVIERASI
jgi:pantoate--beta-alanine ligase